MSEIDVSVFMLTYNQEDFIAQAIEGVLMQRTSFKYELVIGEDYSSDRTREICIEYAEKYPKKVRLLLNKENYGIGKNYVETYKQCSGKYVAICDGDDFWTDPLKLQKQVDFLENNTDYKLIFSEKNDLFPSGEIIGPKNFNRSDTTTFLDLVQGNYIASVTALFINTPLTEQMKALIRTLPYGDWPTYLLVLCSGGRIYHMKEPTATYRKDFGTSKSLRRIKSKMGEINLKILQEISDEKDFKLYKASISQSIIRHQIGLMASLNKDKRYLRSLSFFFTLIRKKNRLKLIQLYFYSLKRSLKNN